VISPGQDNRIEGICGGCGIHAWRFEKMGDIDGFRWHEGCLWSSPARCECADRQDKKTMKAIRKEIQ
jgi:hypothetical protein